MERKVEAAMAQAAASSKRQAVSRNSLKTKLKKLSQQDINRVLAAASLPELGPDRLDWFNIDVDRLSVDSVDYLKCATTSILSARSGKRGRGSSVPIKRPLGDRKAWKPSGLTTADKLQEVEAQLAALSGVPIATKPIATKQEVDLTPPQSTLSSHDVSSSSDSDSSSSSDSDSSSSGESFAENQTTSDKKVKFATPIATVKTIEPHVTGRLQEQEKCKAADHKPVPPRQKPNPATMYAKYMCDFSY